jgi:hypothetical protein
VRGYNASTQRVKSCVTSLARERPFNAETHRRRESNFGGSRRLPLCLRALKSLSTDYFGQPLRHRRGSEARPQNGRHARPLPACERAVAQAILRPFRRGTGAQSGEHPGCPQSQAIDGWSASPSQKTPQYLLSSAALQLQPGCAHFLVSFFGMPSPYAWIIVPGLSVRPEGRADTGKFPSGTAFGVRSHTAID